jgi:hypothetical protein
MVAYANMIPEDLNIICDHQSIWLGQLFESVAGLYTDLVVQRTINPYFIYSDHSPFWDNGYSAILGIEDAPINYPYYHTQYDTLDKLNMDFFTKSARASLATVAELALPVGVSPGDVDWNGEVDSVDLLLLAAVLTENLALQTHHSIQTDLNGDGTINALDLLELHLLVSEPDA